MKITIEGMTVNTKNVKENRKIPTRVDDTYTFTYCTDISGSVTAKEVLEATRHLFRHKGIYIEEFDDLKLINNLAVWELHIVTNSTIATKMPDTECDDTRRKIA